MVRVKNISPSTRTWINLSNAETGQTLCLAPGESAPINEPAPTNDPWLEVESSTPVVTPTLEPPSTTIKTITITSQE
ncbi:MAG: hypothetical protein QXL94_00535 [Candidatus Parvarchaeum sp.]